MKLCSSSRRRHHRSRFRSLPATATPRQQPESPSGSTTTASGRADQPTAARAARNARSSRGRRSSAVSARRMGRGTSRPVVVVLVPSWPHSSLRADDVQQLPRVCWVDGDVVMRPVFIAAADEIETMASYDTRSRCRFWGRWSARRFGGGPMDVSKPAPSGRQRRLYPY